METKPLFRQGGFAPARQARGSRAHRGLPPQGRDSRADFLTRRNAALSLVCSTPQGADTIGTSRFTTSHLLFHHRCSHHRRDHHAFRVAHRRARQPLGPGQ